jgi:predicted DNA-binding transcriptional regulator YafY
MKRRSDDLLARSERLMELQKLLHRPGPGWSARQLAAQFGDEDVVLRTIQRDLNYLRDLLDDQPWFDGTLLGPGRGPYSLPPGVYPFTPLQLSLHEARALLFGLRLLLHNTGGRDPDALTVLEKVAASFPGSVAVQAELLRQLFDTPIAESKEDREQRVVLHAITDAWASSHTITVRYQSPGKNPRTFDFDPYLLTPGGANAATYLTGHSHLHGEVRTLVLSRVVRATPTRSRFTAPALADLVERMEQSFGGVILGDEEHRVVLEFSPDSAVRARESHPVPGRTITPSSGGGLRMEMTLPSLLDVVPWVLSWGPDVQVVEPPELRQRVVESLKRAAANYA